MIKRSLLKKSVELFEFEGVNLSLITSDKIVGDVLKDDVEDIIPIAIKHDYVILFRQSADPKRLEFEIFLDLPF